VSTGTIEYASWDQLDPIFTLARRRLFQDPEWRYGPRRVHEVARRVFDRFRVHGGIEGKVYCDLGCGEHHPFGTSAILLLNGAASTVALDRVKFDLARAAEALFDLLTDCLIDPDSWHWRDGSRGDFLKRIEQFDLRALRAGDLERGIADVPMRLVSSELSDCPIGEGSIDRMSSQAALEHFLDFERAISRLRSMMAPEGIAYHAIDLVDHRSYVDPQRYHWWSFLAEGSDWSDGLCNRLRYSEIRKKVEEAGFEILRFDGARRAMPPGFESQIRGRFAEMPRDELETYGIECVIRNPIVRTAAATPIVRPVTICPS
jgi:hypothetical protein